MSNNYQNPYYSINNNLLSTTPPSSTSYFKNVPLNQNKNYSRIRGPLTNNNITRKNEPMENLDPTSKAFYYVWLIFGILVIAMMGYNSYLMKDFSENADNYTTKEVISITKKMEFLKLGTFISFTLSLGSLLAYVAYSSIRSDHHNSLKTIRPFAIIIVFFYGLIYLYGIAIQLINMFKNDLSLVFTLYEIYIGLIGLIILIKLIKAFVMNRTIKHVGKEREYMIRTKPNMRQRRIPGGNQRNSNQIPGGNQRNSNQIPRNQRNSNQIPGGNQRISNQNIRLGVRDITRQSQYQVKMVQRN